MDQTSNYKLPKPEVSDSVVDIISSLANGSYITDMQLKLNANGLSALDQKLTLAEDDIKGLDLRVNILENSGDNKNSTEPCYVNVKDYATGNGLTDDAPGINKAIRNMDSKGILFFPEGTYLIQSAIILQSGILYKGVEGKTIIKIVDTSFTVGKYLPTSEGAICNANFALSYNASTADNFIIEGITFEHSNSSSSRAIRDTLLFGNVNGIVIKNCKFIANGTYYTTNIDLYSCCKNADIYQNHFENITQYSAGGCMWVKNHSDNGAISANETMNIRVYRNTFIKNSDDEIIAIYGRDGMCRRVDFSHNLIQTYGTKITIAMAVFAREDNGNPNAAVKDVTIAHNFFEIEDFSSSVIQVGMAANNINPVKNIIIEGNIINARVTSTNYSTVIKYDSNPSSEGVLVRGNIIDNSSNTQILYGISKDVDIVEGNELNGNFSASIRKGKLVANNKVKDNSAGAAAENCSTVINNLLFNVLIGIKLFSTEKFFIEGNQIELTNDLRATGILLLNISNSVPIAYANHNFLILQNTASTAFSISGGTLSLTGNIKEGPGIFIKGTLAFAQGNKVDAVGYDTQYPGRITDPNIDYALPVGHITIDTSAGNVWGWQKILPGAGINKWRPIKV